MGLNFKSLRNYETLILRSMTKLRQANMGNDIRNILYINLIFTFHIDRETIYLQLKRSLLQTSGNPPVLGPWPVKTGEDQWKPLLCQSSCLAKKIPVGNPSMGTLMLTRAVLNTEIPSATEISIWHNMVLLWNSHTVKQSRWWFCLIQIKH